MKAAFPSSPAAIEAGKVLFTKYCRFCHGNTGAGDSTMAPKNMKPSNLTDAEWTRGSSDGEIFWIIQNGAPPKYEMKGLKGKVNDADTWNLVHFVRSLGGARQVRGSGPAPSALRPRCLMATAACELASPGQPKWNDPRSAKSRWGTEPVFTPARASFGQALR